MSVLSHLLGQGTEGREAVAEPIAPPPESVAALSPELVEAAAVRPPYPSVRLLGAILAGVHAAEPDAWAAVLAPACQRHGIGSPARVLAFLANVLHETAGLTQLHENLNYSCEGLLATFGSARIGSAEAAALGRKPGEAALPLARQLAIADVVYGGSWGLRNLGNRPGTLDGRTYIGRGLCQLTGRANYERLAAATHRDIGTLPAWLETKEGAAEGAAAFWAWAGCNKPADAGNVGTCRRLVCGGYIGIADVIQRHDACKVLLGRYAAYA